MLPKYFFFLSHRHNAFKKNKIGITLRGISKTLVINENLYKTNKAKQSLAIIPNIIHSLDASHLSNVIINAFENETYPILTIHDCFGTHPNLMDQLYNIVKIEFIKIYLTENFIDKFHTKNLDSISEHGYIIEKDNITEINYIKIKNSKIFIPNKPKIGNFDLNEIQKSKYIIT